MAIVCGVKTQEPERYGNQQRKNQDQGQDDQVKGSGRTDLLPTKTLNKEKDRSNGRDAQCACGGNQRKFRVDQVIDTLNSSYGGDDTRLHRSRGLAQNVNAKGDGDQRKRHRHGDLEAIFCIVGLPVAAQRFENEQ